MPVPIRAVVGRFSFDFSRAALERAMSQVPFEFCAVLSTTREPPFPGVPPDAQEWFVSSEIRSAHYAGADWTEIAPLDEDLIEAMRGCETVFMAMVARLEWKREVPYATRRLWYLRHLRFWNDYLTRHRINLYLSAWIPHEIPDLVIYHLCKRRGIPVLYFHTTTLRDVSFPETDIAASADRVGRRYEALLAAHPFSTDPESIPLTEPFLSSYRSLVVTEASKPVFETLRRATYWSTVGRMLLRSPARGLRHATGFLAPRGWGRALSAIKRSSVIRATEKFYDRHAVEPDLSRPYVYFPLHFQPEASTLPMGGAYGDQILVAAMLNAALPEGVLIYVKEHPRRSAWLYRSPAFYREFLALAKVRLVARGADTFTLREHCRAVATVSGSAGFEALFRGKPVLLFGYRFYQYARGVFRIRTTEDCRRAVRAVFDEGSKPTLLESRLYLKAMEDTCVRGVLDPWKLRATRQSKEEHSRAMGEAIAAEVGRLGVWH